MAFDLFVSDAADANNKEFVIEIADRNDTGNWLNQGNRLRWNLDDVTLVKGWNRIILDMADAQVLTTTAQGKSTTFDPSNLGYVWIYVKGMADGDQLGIRNIAFEMPPCDHESCQTCGGCLEENCTCTDECCTEKCECPVVTWEPGYSFSVPAADAVNSWIAGGRWCAGTNGSGFWWPTASDLKNAEDTKLVAYNGTEIKVTAGQTSGTGSSPTGLMFITADPDANPINTGVTVANGRLTLDIYVSNAAEANTNGVVIEPFTRKYTTAKPITMCITATPIFRTRMATAPKTT